MNDCVARMNDCVARMNYYLNHSFFVNTSEIGANFNS